MAAESDGDGAKIRIRKKIWSRHLPARRTTTSASLTAVSKDEEERRGSERIGEDVRFGVDGADVSTCHLNRRDKQMDE